MASFDVDLNTAEIRWNRVGTDMRGTARAEFSETGGLLTRSIAITKTISRATWLSLTGQQTEDQLKTEFENYLDAEFAGGPHTVNYT